MQSTTHTSLQKSNYSQAIVFLPAIDSHLQVVNRNPAIKEFATISRYHTEVIQYLAGLKASAKVSQQDKPACQEEFICLSMLAIREYSILFTDTVSRIATAGLKNYSNMILSGASLFLGGDAEGSFFQTVTAITDQKFKNRNNLFRLISCAVRKEDHGICTGFIQELLAELKSFCHDHPLYNEIMEVLAKS